MLGIYIHVPFCDGKCPYCDFYSLPLAGELKEPMLAGPDTQDVRLDYINQICVHLAQWGKVLGNPKASTLYFGGGTPGLLGAAGLSRLVQAAKENFDLAGAEITAELNPASAGAIDFDKLRWGGVNRLSIGLQSADPTELRLLGRRHTVLQAEQTVRRAQAAGFDNISLDLMLAIPGQTDESLARSVDFCARLDVQHISAYLLKIEEGTPFAACRNGLGLPDDDGQARRYLLACRLLEQAGYGQYEISNFSKPHRESRHNLNYWNMGDYLGLGPGAHSFFGQSLVCCAQKAGMPLAIGAKLPAGRAIRFYCPPDLAAFLGSAWPAELIEEEEDEEISPGSPQEYAMLRLRLASGLIEEEYRRRFGTPIPEKWQKAARRYEPHGLTRCSQQGFCFTKEGFLVSNRLTAEILF